jgi:hypothetical protein
MVALVLFQARVLVRRRWTACLAVYPSNWSPTQVLAWDRWRLVFGLGVIASWAWGGAAFCLGLLLSRTVALPSLWLAALNILLVLTLGWLGLAQSTFALPKPAPRDPNFTFQPEPGMWLSVAVPSFNLSNLAPNQLAKYKVMAAALVVCAFLCPTLIVAESYFAPPFGSNMRSPSAP